MKAKFLLGDVKAILLLAAILVIVAVGIVEFPNWTNFVWNWGFGPDWECHPTYGGPACVKNAGRR